jgi:hypothetical protein
VTEGVKTFALDAATGEIRWSHVDEPAAERFQSPDWTVQGIGGSMSIVKDRVWATGYFSTPLALDRSGGTDHRAGLKHKILARRALFLRGRDLVHIHDSLVLAGGGDLLQNHQMREGKKFRTLYRLFYCNGEGDWVLDPGPRKIFVSIIPPACDDELLVSAGPPRRVAPRGFETRPSPDATAGLYAWPLADFREAVNGLQKKPLIVKEKQDRIYLNTKGMGILSHEGAAWHKPGLRVNAIALTKDAALAAHGVPEEHEVTWKEKISRTMKDARSPNLRVKGWKLTAFSRDGKETLWEVDLPQEPLFSGIAVARDGSVLVTLRDGSILCLRGER